MKADIKYVYDQSTNLANQITGKCYRMQIAKYSVAGIDDWENATQCNFLIIQLHKTMISKW